MPSTLRLSTYLRRLPWSLLAVGLLLIVAGWLGIARAEELAETSGRMLRGQIVWSCLALLAMIGAAVPSYLRLRHVSYTAFAVGLALLVLVYFFPPVNGAHRWIRVFGVGFQPSEFMKVLFVLMLARYLMHRENFRTLRGLLAPLALTMLPVLLILREPDLGTSAVFLPVLFAMLFTAGARRRDLALVVTTGVLLLPVLWSQMSREQHSRVTALFDQTAPDETPGRDNFHLHQAKQMLALGGLWGSALGGEVVADRSVYFVPEGATDSIFVVLGERFGLVGVAALLGLYVLLVWRALVIAEATREPFGRLVAAGIAALFAAEVLINSGMMVGLVPITGLSLPLVSYGGSGLLAHALALGLLLNIALRPGYEVGDEPFRYAV